MPLDQPEPALRRPAPAAPRRRRRRRRWGRSARRPRRPARRRWLRSMPITGVMPLPAVTNSVRAGGASGARSPRRPGRGAPACPGCSERDHVVADRAARDRLDGDAKQPVGAAGGRGQRVGAPLADAVDVDAEADVLAGRVPAPGAAGADRTVTASAVSGSTAHHPAAQVGARAQRRDQVEVVGGDQRGRDGLREAGQRVAGRAQRATQPGAARGGQRHHYATVTYVGVTYDSVATMGACRGSHALAGCVP